MFASRSAKRLTLWMALVAILMMAVAPLVSQVVGADREWQEICGVGGARWVQTSTADPGQDLPQSPAHLLDHCPYCSLHADALGMPPSPLAALPALPAHTLPPAFLQAPYTLHAWLTAQPRGPPQIG
ncbi:DUF2946 domain-containing protein [Roseateles depolymerans]|uniref:Uncharacterized protein n=1 Tax=Roseateles depolymerans TaxID=76731 RepID=A0A0U3MLP9_9BURK|nr:DUF2946 domain-containing protein [Roseateles depolymerans]ALV05210.1 hypothetical protein RD2015_714 [Roseateles depolymerans]REG14774.1 DUF2946 family protein [Roseateles depolymerans]